MPSAISYLKQSTQWNCGPAVMRMVLAAYGIKKSEKQLEQELSTSKEKGTNHKSISALAENYKLNYIVKRNSTLRDLKKFQKKNFIIIAYNPENEKIGHFAIIKAITSKSIYLFDPFYGPDHSYSLIKFINLWHDGEGNKEWMMAIEKKNG